MPKQLNSETSILNHLQGGDLSSAQRLLVDWRPHSEEEGLRHLYCQSKIFLYEGAFLKALEKLQILRKQRPQDLDSLCDLALCYYHLGLQTDLEAALSEAHSIFLTLTPRITSQKELDQGIFLAKLMEETACYQEALVLLRIPPVGLNGKQEMALKIQRLRLSVELQDQSQARTLYREVISGQDHNLNFEIEREHTLLIADAFLIGLPQAWERFEYASSQKLTPPDLNFLKSEMAELTILHKQTHLLERLELSEASESSYERIQAQLIGLFLQGAKKPQFSVIRLEKILSRMSLLRILRQALLLFPLASEENTWLDRYQFHCQTLPTRALQESFLAPLRAQRFGHFDADTKRRTISVNGKTIEFKTSLFWKLLAVFSEGKQEMSVDEVIATLYQELPNSQHFDRLRIAIYRLNGLLEKKGILKPLFKVTKNKVYLLSSIKELAS